MVTLKWEQNTMSTLSNVEKGLRGAHAGLDGLQKVVDEARELMDAEDYTGVKMCMRMINRALSGVVPLRLHRESDPNLRQWTRARPWEV